MFNSRRSTPRISAFNDFLSSDTSILRSGVLRILCYSATQILN